MIIEINGKVYGVDKKTFDSIIEMVKEKKTGSYCIFCVVSSNRAVFTDEFYQSKEEMLKQVGNYTAKKFKVFYTAKEA